MNISTGGQTMAQHCGSAALGNCLAWKTVRQNASRRVEEGMAELGAEKYFPVMRRVG
jgi:hypothetical protein